MPLSLSYRSFAKNHVCIQIDNRTVIREFLMPSLD